MASVGVRELRQRASELLRRVEAGETIEITDRGRPVARLAPLPDGSRLEVLKSAGEVDSSTAEFADLPEPMASRASMLPSAMLDRLRSGER
jgi:prevent-host-death family protein